MLPIPEKSSGFFGKNIKNQVKQLPEVAVKSVRYVQRNIKYVAYCTRQQEFVFKVTPLKFRKLRSICSNYIIYIKWDFHNSTVV